MEAEAGTNETYKERRRRQKEVQLTKWSATFINWRKSIASI